MPRKRKITNKLEDLESLKLTESNEADEDPQNFNPFLPRLKIKDDRDYVAQVVSPNMQRQPQTSTPVGKAVVSVQPDAKLNSAEEEATSPSSEETKLPKDSSAMIFSEEQSNPSSDAVIGKSIDSKKVTKTKKNVGIAPVESTEKVESTKPASVARQNKRTTKKKKPEEVDVAPRRSGRTRKQPERYTA